MKHLVSTFIGIFLFFTTSFAQVSDVEKTMSQGTKNGLSLDIKNVTLKSVEKDWKKFIKDVKKEPIPAPIHLFQLMVRRWFSRQICPERLVEWICLQFRKMKTATSEHLTTWEVL